MRYVTAVLIAFVAIGCACAAGTTQSAPPTVWFGPAALFVFGVSYALVIAEEFLELRKSKAVVVAAGLIWLLVAGAYVRAGLPAAAAELLRHNLLEYAELLLFLLSAMTFINTLEERRVFDAVRARMVAARLSLRSVYWLTGLLAFCISPFADNLTTALVMGAVVLAVGEGAARFVAVGCINIVIAANAGGAFSPFGDITTLMVWQRGVVQFTDFFRLFVPSALNWVIPAAIMSLSVEKRVPSVVESNAEHVKRGGGVVLALFVATIALTVGLHQFLHLPPFLGMMTGLGVLMLYGHFLRRRDLHARRVDREPFDIFISVRRVEWDTLLFFYGVTLCVGGLGALGYLASLAQWMYGDLGATSANIVVGIASAVIDNIPVMFAVLSMDPEMSLGQWLLVTLTA